MVLLGPLLGLFQRVPPIYRLIILYDSSNDYREKRSSTQTLLQLRSPCLTLEGLLM
jgi:hypothetical protein